MPLRRFILSLLLATLAPLPARAEKWQGIDETVVEKVAAAASRPARPFFSTDHGDLPLFLGILSGAAAGFAAGYLFRALFPPRPRLAKGPAAHA